MKTLLDLKFNEEGIVKKIHAGTSAKERLHSFGLVKGIKISYVKNSPLGCPRIYSCLNTEIAIRNGLASKVEIV